MGPAILARAGLGFAAKIHGSALEYTVKPEPERFLPYAREGIDAAAGVLVGSRHTAESLWEAIGDPGLPARTRLGPPGVDTELFRPLARRGARRGAWRSWRRRWRRRRREAVAPSPATPAPPPTRFAIWRPPAARASSWSES